MTPELIGFLVIVVAIVVLGVGLAMFIRAGLGRLESRIDGSEQRLEGRIDAMEQRIEGRIDALDQRMSTLDQRVSALEQRVSTSEQRMSAIEQRPARLEGVLDGLREALFSTRAS